MYDFYFSISPLVNFLLDFFLPLVFSRVHTHRQTHTHMLTIAFSASHSFLCVSDLFNRSNRCSFIFSMWVQCYSQAVFPLLRSNLNILLDVLCMVRTFNFAMAKSVCVSLCVVGQCSNFHENTGINLKIHRKI